MHPPHAGAHFFLGDQDNDGRTDLVCRGTDGFHWIDFADCAGRFGGNDVTRFSPDFLITSITREEREHRIRVFNQGADGVVSRVRCERPGQVADSAAVTIPARSSRTILIGALPMRPGTVTCRVEGRSPDGQPELVISNNSYSASFP